MSRGSLGADMAGWATHEANSTIVTRKQIQGHVKHTEADGCLIKVAQFLQPIYTAIIL